MQIDIICTIGGHQVLMLSWQARYFIEPNALEGTIITNDITAYKNTTTYNYNTKEVWDGETLRVVSGLEEDIIIKRTN